MKRVRFIRLFASFAFVLMAAAAVAQEHFAYMGTLDKKLLIMNEDTDNIIGEIPLAGVPRTIVTSADQKQFYILNTDMAIEIVDISTRKVAGSINLMDMGGKVRVVAGSRNWMNGAGSQARFSGIVVDPNGRYLYSTMRVVRKDLSEYHLDPPQFAVIDLTTKSVVKRMDFPKEYDTGFGFQASFKVSPDGKYLWVFDDDITILDLATFKVVDKIALSKPPYPGASPYRLSPTDMPYDGTNKVTSIFVSVDPVVHKGTLGVATMDMTTRKVDYKPIGVQLPMIGFLIAPGGKVGYSVMYAGAGANRTTEWWAWDLVNHKVTKKEPLESRSTFSFGMSGDGSKLYLYGSGPSVEVFNAATLKSEKFIDLKKDLTTRVVTLDPTRSGSASAQ
jgi:hypothetical protein